MVESGKYANTCFFAFAALGAGVKTLGKATIAGVKEAKSALQMVKAQENGFVKVVSNLYGLTTKDIPSVRNGEFNKFFNSLTFEELDEILK